MYCVFACQGLQVLEQLMGRHEELLLVNHLVVSKLLPDV